MKRPTTLISLLVLSLSLAACSSIAAIGTTTQTGMGTPNAPDGALSTEMQLAVGTLLLDEDGHPVSAETAAELLPLWKAVRSLGSSETITSQEYQALFKQIQETMPAEQRDAITAMQLTQEVMIALTEKLDITLMGGGGGKGTPSPEMLETLQAARESGEMPQFQGGDGGPMPGGGVPGGGGRAFGGEMPVGGGDGFPGGGGMDPSMGGAGMPTQDGSSVAPMRGGVVPGIPTELLNAVIDYLQTKVNG